MNMTDRLTKNLTFHCDRTSLLVCLLLILFVFQNPLQQIFPLFQYFDEFYAVLCFPLCILAAIQHRLKKYITRPRIIALAFLVLFEGIGWLSSFVFHYQPLFNALADSLVSIKFFLSIGTSLLLFSASDRNKLLRNLIPVMAVLTVFLFLFCLADLLFSLFPTDERFGLRSIRLFYSHQTILLTACSLLIAIWFRLSEFLQSAVLVPLGMLGFVLALTLRAKSFATIAMAALFYYLILFRKRKPGLLAWLAGGVAAVAVSAKQVAFYAIDFLNRLDSVPLVRRIASFLSDLLGNNMEDSYAVVPVTETARGALMNRSLDVAADHFPLGSGWATFGSNFSIEPYSPLYYNYHMDTVWGLSPDYSEFVCDSFWPSLLAQTGWFGLLFFAGALVVVARAISGLWKQNRFRYASALVLFVYLLISSTCETAFSGIPGVPAAFWIGLLFAESTAKGE